MPKLYSNQLSTKQSCLNFALQKHPNIHNWKQVIDNSGSFSRKSTYGAAFVLVDQTLVTEYLFCVTSHRLWHQLTEYLLQFVFNSDNFQRNSTNMIDLYHNFINKFETSMNQTSFARIVCRISKQYQS